MSEQIGTKRFDIPRLTRRHFVRLWGLAPLALAACGGTAATSTTTQGVTSTATAAQTSATVAATATTASQATATRASATAVASATRAAGGPGGGAPPAGGGGGMPGGASETLDTFKGITTNGTVITDLFKIQPTGIPTTGVKQAAETFLASLTETQRAKTVYAVDDDEWRKWSNIDSYQRQGMKIEEMTDTQKNAAYALMAAALSVKGNQLARDVMKLNTTEGEIMNNLTGFNENLYYFMVMGTPSDIEPWGFQVDGHHLVINYFILGDQVMMTPVFMGAEPPVATTGTYAGLSVLQTEQDKGLTFMKAMPAAQQAQAALATAKSADNNVAEAFKDNVVLDYAGVKIGDLATGLQTQLLDLINQYVSNMDDGHAKVRMDEVRAQLAQTYFAWIGTTGADWVFYYRIQSPVILIEFDHEGPGPAGQALGSTGPSRKHIHTVVRTPNGNDYGKDLLRQHYAKSAHHNAALSGLLGGGMVSAAPMTGAAGLVYNTRGKVAWDRIWTDFCDLGLRGGPPHRGTLLGAANAKAVQADRQGYRRVTGELERGLGLVTGWAATPDAAPGWVGLDCSDATIAAWMQEAIAAENVAARREGERLLLPASPDFALDKEIKNVVTATAKTKHYWTEHAATHSM